MTGFKLGNNAKNVMLGLLGLDESAHGYHNSCTMHGR
jgi:hypothetical protein